VSLVSALVAHPPLVGASRLLGELKDPMATREGGSE
jgi:hypothetical protein